jgi:hypothetical protein
MEHPVSPNLAALSLVQAQVVLALAQGASVSAAAAAASLHPSTVYNCGDAGIADHAAGEPARGRAGGGVGDWLSEAGAASPRRNIGAFCRC